MSTGASQELPVAGNSEFSNIRPDPQGNFWDFTWKNGNVPSQSVTECTIVPIANGYTLVKHEEQDSITVDCPDDVALRFMSILHPDGASIPRAQNGKTTASTEA